MATVLGRSRNPVVALAFAGLRKAENAEKKAPPAKKAAPKKSAAKRKEARK